MAIPTQFSVANKRSAPLANPDQPIDNANPLTAEDVSFISGASTLPVKSAGDIAAPSELTAQVVGDIDNASLFSALSVGTINNPSIVAAESVAPVDDASLIGAESQPSVPLPSTASAESAPSIATPSALTAKAGTLTVPPFPLNHARMLSSNKLFSFDSVSSDVGGVASNALTPNTWEKWRPPSDGYFKVILTSNQDVDTVCIGAHNFGSRGFTVSPQYRETPTGPLIQFAAARAPTTDAPLMFHRSSSVNIRVIEIYISGGSNGEAGYISAGLALQMQRPFFNGHTPITDADVTEYYSNRTESGEIIGQQIRRKGFETTAEWQNIDDEWYRVYFAPFKHAIKTKPFFFAWNLLEYPDDVGLVRISQDIRAPMQNGSKTKRSISMSMLGAG